jgi:hypothetical protein
MVVPLAVTVVLAVVVVDSTTSSTVQQVHLVQAVLDHKVVMVAQVSQEQVAVAVQQQEQLATLV